MALTTVLGIVLLVLPFASGVVLGDSGEPDVRILYVDRNSVGGRCADTRSVAEVSDRSTPWCSFRRALASAPGGSVVKVRKGAYPALTALTALTALDAPRSAPITFLGYGGGEDTAIAGISIEGGENLRFEGLRITGPVVIDETSHHIDLVDNRISIKAEAHGVTLAGGTHDVLIEDNHITVPKGSGVHFSSTTTRPEISRVTVRSNHFDGIGVVGVQARRFVDVTLEANEFEGVQSWDGEVHPDVIRTYAGGSGLVIRANYLHDNAAQGIFIKDGAVEDAVIENNLVVRTAGGFKAFNVYDVAGLSMVNNTFVGAAIFQGRATGVVLKNNIFGSLSRSAPVQLDYEDHNYIGAGSFPGTGPHDLDAGLNYAAPGSYDYCLAAGSAGIDAGTSNAAPARDRLRRPRVDDPDARNVGTGPIKYQDLGACERQAG